MALDADPVEGQALLNQVGDHLSEQGVLVGDHVGVGFVDPQFDAVVGQIPQAHGDCLDDSAAPNILATVLDHSSGSGAGRPWAS